MPSRNIRRFDLPESYYHVYNRGINKAIVFAEPADKEYFLYLLSRHLSLEPVTNKQGYTYPHYRGKLELLSFCLMDNHFHLLFYQVEAGTLTEMMKSVAVAYSVYFNRKHQRRGPLFESRFMASRISDNSYLQHISRYIHLNPRSWRRFKFSSLHYIEHWNEPDWLQTERLLALFASRTEYLEFVADYRENARILDEIKHELANL
ncbi:MAG TPA: transposase [Candidatus Saccharimonadales bacterium]|nr:transposase [Candidatus Saccharimonadales bacterium]